MGWLSIWNAERAASRKPALDLSDRDTSQVWRFELRLGSKQLRNRFAMHSWQDLHDMIGDAFTDALSCIHYRCPTSDSNRSRWPTHELWRIVEQVIGNDLHQNCAGVLPSDIIHANRIAKMHELDAQLLGLFITRAAISDVSGDDFEGFMESHVDALGRILEKHPSPIGDRIAKAKTRYRLH